MTTSSTSYLQTLAKDEAIAFIASLQSVRAHLSQELQWISEQVQQKVAQLQGIETLLSEAEALGLVTTDTPATEEISAVTATPVRAASVATPESVVERPAAQNGKTSIEAMEPVTPASAASSVKKPTTQPRDGKGKAAPVETRGSKLLANTKTSTTKAKQPKPSTLTARKVNQLGKESGSQRFLQNQWRNKALTEAVGDILNGASVPLSTDDVMAELYDGLLKEDYDRAKHSLANILSVGRSKGAWRIRAEGAMPVMQLPLLKHQRDRPLTQQWL